jgi:hypothetical protein
MLTTAILMTGCSSLSANAGTREAQAVRPAVPVAHAGEDVVVQKVAFRPGVSSATVEHLAKRFSCTTNGMGAGLIVEKGPVEMYRMQCDNGTTFIAMCEFRQCRPMR